MAIGRLPCRIPIPVRRTVIPLHRIEPACSTQQLQRVHADPFGQALHRPQCQIAFAPFHAAHVGAVHAEEIGERFLTKPAGFAVPPQVPAHGALQVALHALQRGQLLLDDLQTDK